MALFFSPITSWLWVHQEINFSINSEISEINISQFLSIAIKPLRYQPLGDTSSTSHSKGISTILQLFFWLEELVLLRLSSK